MIQTTHLSYADLLSRRTRGLNRVRPQQLLGFLIWLAFLGLLILSSRA